MKKHVLGIFLALFSVLSFAQSTQVSVDISKLTPEQQKAVQAVANQMMDKKSEASTVLQAIQSIDSNKIRGWADAGTEAGKAVGNFATEIGAVASTFLESFVGKAIFFLVFMNYGGGKLAQFAFNVFAFLVLVPCFLYFMRQIFNRYVLQIRITKEIKYNANPFLRFIGLNEISTKTEKIEPEEKDDIPPIAQAGIAWAVILICSGIFFFNIWPKW